MDQFIIFNPRCEADNYGFSIWLSRYLGLDFVPFSKLRLQHGWYWFPYREGKEYMNFFWGKSNGILVQNEEFAIGLNFDGTLAYSVGLPFQLYYLFSGIKDRFSESRNGTLFVPIRSYPSSNYSKEIIESVSRFAESHDGFGVLLSFDDRVLGSAISRYTSKIEIGAAVNEANSFERLARIFESYDTVYTTSMGSHVLYADICGAKVKLPTLDPYEYRGQDLRHVEDGDMKNLYASRFYSSEYLANLFPQLVFSMSHQVRYPTRTMAQQQKLSVCHPKALSHLLGWNT
jgi:hypothetical protein